MVTLYGSFFFYYTTLAVVVPFLQVMVRNLGYSYKAVGALLSVYEAVGIIGPLIIAQFIDRSGRMRNTLLFSAVVSMVAIVLLARSSTIYITIIALMLLGFFYRPLMPALDSHANNQYKGKSSAYSNLRAFGSFGYTALSLFFVFTGHPQIANNRNIGLWAVAMIGVFLLFTVLWPKDTPAPLPKLPKDRKKAGRWFDRAFIPGMIIIALNRFVIAAINSFFSLYLVEELGITSISLMNAIASGSEIFMIVIAGYLIDRKKVLPIHLFGISSLALALRVFIYTTTPSFGWVVFGQALHSLCYGAFQPAAIYFIARRVKRHRRTLGMSIYTSLGTGLPAVLGSLIGGVVIQRYGYATLFGSYGLVALLSFFLSLFLFPIMRTPPIEEG